MLSLYLTVVLLGEGLKARHALTLCDCCVVG